MLCRDNDTNVLLPTYLRDIFPVQLAINNTKAKDGSQLSDYCFEPMKGEGCMIQTPLDYWYVRIRMLWVR